MQGLWTDHFFIMIQFCIERYFRVAGVHGRQVLDIGKLFPTNCFLLMSSDLSVPFHRQGHPFWCFYMLLHMLCLLSHRRSVSLPCLLAVWAGQRLFCASSNDSGTTKLSSAKARRSLIIIIFSRILSGVHHLILDYIFGTKSLIQVVTTFWR